MAPSNSLSQVKYHWEETTSILSYPDPHSSLLLVAIVVLVVIKNAIIVMTNKIVTFNKNHFN